MQTLEGIQGEDWWLNSTENTQWVTPVQRQICTKWNVPTMPGAGIDREPADDKACHKRCRKILLSGVALSFPVRNRLGPWDMISGHVGR